MHSLEAENNEQQIIHSLHRRNQDVEEEVISNKEIRRLKKHAEVSMAGE